MPFHQNNKGEDKFRKIEYRGLTYRYPTFLILSSTLFFKGNGVQPDDGYSCISSSPLGSDKTVGSGIER
jgi:hypothetical protein